jgi:hypothetical protein
MIIKRYNKTIKNVDDILLVEIVDCYIIRESEDPELRKEESTLTIKHIKEDQPCLVLKHDSFIGELTLMVQGAYNHRIDECAEIIIKWIFDVNNEKPLSEELKDLWSY